MCLTEFLFFNSIPVKVSINEYLELAKEYSSPKSKIFINGIMDTISKQLIKNGRIKKIKEVYNNSLILKNINFKL